MERAVAASRAFSERAGRVGREASARARQTLDRGRVWSRARGYDLLDEAAFRTLTLVHDGLGLAVRSLSRLERATSPPARGHARRNGSGSPSSEREGATADQSRSGGEP